MPLSPAAKATTKGTDALSFDGVVQAFEQLVDLARAGDARARALFERHGRLLGQWLGNVVNLIAPQQVVLDGSGVIAADLYEAALRQAMTQAMVMPAPPTCDLDGAPPR